MLRKFIAIRGVGAFEAYSCKGDVTLRPFTAIWGPNAVGKSTLCDILRSFTSGDASFVLGRQSVGFVGDPEIELLFDSGKRSFRGGTWDAPSDPQIHIFDSFYVHENIHVGDFVEHDQRKNLYRIIVGEEGVKLASAVDALDDAHREATKAVVAQRDMIREQLPLGLDVDEFMMLALDPEIGVRIEAKERDIAAVQQAEAIASRAILTQISLPEIPSEIDELLAMTLESVGAEAERLVREHIVARHVREAWVSEGFQSLQDDRCPFCGQDVADASLLRAYRGYFGESYGALKGRVAARVREVADSFGSAVKQRLHVSVSRNMELGLEWASLVGEAWSLSLSFDPIDEARNVLVHALQKKEATPLEKIEPVLADTRIVAYRALADKVEHYNEAVSAFNVKVGEVKSRARAGKLEQAERELAVLVAHRQRFEEPATTDCEQLRERMAQRNDLDQQKIETKRKLDDHAVRILAAYQASINRFLQKFGASFRITQMERRYSGGTPSSSYVLEINNVRIELGDRKTSQGERSFRNTLSGGDRSALALAFFLSQVGRDPDVGKKIVVFDDPFTSQDRGRRLCTQQEIRRLREKALQIIVLSHDDSFLADCCEAVDGSALKTLQLRRILTGPLLDEWDASAPRGQSLQDSQRLKEFLADGGGGDPTALRAIARTIRPLLEAHLRGRFLGHFGDPAWLGDMIVELRKNAAKVPEGASLPDELEAINEYSRRYHHAQNPGADTESIDPNELRTYVERALAVADGF